VASLGRKPFDNILSLLKSLFQTSFSNLILTMASAYKTSGGRCCGTKKSRTIWCLVSVLLLIGIGLTIYFLFPRFPTIYVNPPGDLSAINSVNYNTNSSNPLQGIINASEQNPFILSINISVLVTVYSPNYIDIYANRINVEVNRPSIFF
jgi:hypothetical protein